jgi:hypothetical protein
MFIVILIDNWWFKKLILTHVKILIALARIKNTS